MLDTRPAVRNLSEIVPAQLFLFLETKRAMVSRYHLQIVAAKAGPQLVLVPFLAERRCHHILGPLEPFLFVQAVVKEEILRAGFGVGRQPEVACTTNLLQSVVAA